MARETARWRVHDTSNDLVRQEARDVWCRVWPRVCYTIQRIIQRVVQRIVQRIIQHVGIHDPRSSRAENEGEVGVNVPSIILLNLLTFAKLANVSDVSNVS